MVRAFAWLLVAANVVVFVWAITRGDASRQGAAAVAEPDDAAAPGVDRLILLSEAPKAASESATRMRDTPASCARIGRFARMRDASDVAARGRFLGLGADVVALDLPSGPPDLQVHLPPRPSPDGSMGALRELAALGQEAYLVEEGILRGAVSVGVYTDAEGAAARRDEIAALGYEVSITEIPRERRVWDVRLTAPRAEALDAFLLRVRGDFPELSFDPIPCGADAVDPMARARVAGTAGIA